jgi:hypothetical protein
MDLSSIIHLATVIGIISVAVERSNEIIINGFQLDDKLPDASKRKFVYQVLAMVTGAIMYSINNSNHIELIDANFNAFLSPVIVGLLVSAGSGFWHDVLKYFTNISSSKKTMV